MFSSFYIHLEKKTIEIKGKEYIESTNYIKYLILRGTKRNFWNITTNPLLYIPT